MMQMLAAGGMPILSDTARQADTNNPNGYFELEVVKNLETEKTWLTEAQGKAVKIISHLLKFLPDDYTYKIVFMKRELSDVIKSQNRMLLQLGKEVGSIESKTLKRIYKHHLDEIKNWLLLQQNMQAIEVVYEKLLAEPETTIQKIGTHLEIELSNEAVVQVIDQNLNHSSI